MFYILVRKLDVRGFREKRYCVLLLTREENYFVIIVLRKSWEYLKNIGFLILMELVGFSIFLKKSKEVWLLRQINLGLYLHGKII